MTSPKQLIGYVRRYKAGDTVAMTIVRDGARRTCPCGFSELRALWSCVVALCVLGIA